MAHYAKVLDGVVVQVIVAEADFFNNYIDVSPGKWVQASYNTHGGVHALGGAPLRYNFPGKGYIYDANADAFYAPRPYESWTLNTTTYLWEPPTPYPDDGSLYCWNEDSQSWDKVD